MFCDSDHLFLPILKVKLVCSDYPCQADNIKYQTELVLNVFKIYGFLIYRLLSKLVF